MLQVLDLLPCHLCIKGRLSNGGTANIDRCKNMLLTLFINEEKSVISFLLLASHVFLTHLNFTMFSMYAAALLGKKRQTDNKDDFILCSSSVRFIKWKQQ